MAVVADLIEQRVRSAVDVLSTYGKVVAVYIFGSQVTGTANEDSDIDVGVFMEGIENWHLVQKVKTMSRVQKEAGYDIELHLFSAQSFYNPDPASFANFIIQHGVSVAFSTQPSRK